MSWGIIAGIAIPVVIILWLVGMYNGLVRRRVQVQEGWAQIDVQLKRRYDLIPNLVEAVKGYMVHERTVLENVTRARQQAIDVTGVAEQAQAENLLTGALRQLFAVAENYPQLKANENFLQLQEELTSTENKIAFARQFYNDTVRDYNTTLQVFPSNMVGAMFGFRTKPFFELEEAVQREAPQVRF
ncbi:LemA family protein [bacterium]|nr:LemA family protein [bacterium]